MAEVASIVQFINQEKRKFDKIVEDTFFRLQEQATALDPFMPIQSYPDLDLLVGKFRDFPKIGHIIGQEQDIPTTQKKGEFDTKYLGRIFLGAGYNYTSRDFDAMQKFRQRVSEGNTQAARRYRDYFFGTADQLTTQLVNTHTYLTLETYRTGVLNYTDPVTGAIASLEYDTNPNLFPATVATPWDNHANADGIGDIVELLTAFYEEHGFYPDATLMSNNRLRDLTEQTATQQRIVANRIGDAAASTQSLTRVAITQPEIEAMIGRELVPGGTINIITFDAQFEVEGADGGFVRKRFLDENYIVMLTRGMGERALLPFAENDYQAGIYTEAEVISKAPRRERLIAMTAGVPFVPDADLLCAQRVMAD